ncbi:MAG: CehA/McbA family metallohydrolase, partial [Prosthecobacter sp.]|nr:CehA/McbA family metallohydrolase [Prosthecobacter sp.]
LGLFAAEPGKLSIAWLDLTTGSVRAVAGIPESYAFRIRGVYCPTNDGQNILFVEHQDKAGEQGGNNGPDADLWRIDAAGGTPEKVFRWPARIYGMHPDPRSEAVYAVTDGGIAHNDIWHLPLADTLAKARKVTWGQADEDSPSSPASGDVLVYTDNRHGPTALMRQHVASGAEGLITVTSIDLRKPMTELRVVIRDFDGKPATARVSLKHEDGNFHAPAGSMHRRILNRGWFYVTGEATLNVPEGEYEIRAARGLEYKLTTQKASLHGKTTSVEIKLERWTHMAEQGWFSGENHIHANYGYGEWYNTPPSILEQCEGEDLNVANLVVANSDSNGVFDREFFRGQLDPLSKPRTLLWWNEEFRSTIWGHMTLFHLRQVVEPVYTGFPNTTNPWDIPTNGEIARRTHRQGGTASYTHPSNNAFDSYDQPYSAKGLPVDAALNLIDVLDVMGFTYEPSLPLWYRLLNCGLRVPAAAGTDVFLNRSASNPPGFGRVYVQVDGPLTYERWIAGLRQGRSFVSSSPMLEFTVNGEGPGASIRLDKPGTVALKGRVWSHNPVSKLEIIQDGKVLDAGTIAADGLTGSIEKGVAVERSGWLAIRTSGPPCDASMLRSMGAHSNPVWIEIKDKPADSARDAEYFLGWIDRLEADLKKRNRLPEGTQDDVTQHLDQARKVYQGLIR